MPSLPADVPRLVVEGELDVAAVGGLVADAARLTEGHPAMLEIDLRAVTFIDSSGLGALVQARKDAARQGTRVVLINVPSSTQRLLELSGLQHVFDIGTRE